MSLIRLSSGVGVGLNCTGELAMSRASASKYSEASDVGALGLCGSSSGPNQPSCKPRTYSFQACRPKTRSPCTPSQLRIWAPRRNASSRSSVLSSVSSESPFSPFRLRNLLILAARPARTSPSLRPSTTSQSRAPATSTGLTYS